ncbi:MAG: recombinase zinc beta ribbon domain-containing protein [Candidatus Omnitrophica bacterium]|nr:recombinase zinc beta ribbon domain-containing protein [Candidatus Omnitrophota bacterium]
METWNNVQKKIELKSPKRTRQKKIHTYILQGLVKCGCCDSYMTPKYSTGRTRLHPYYQCTRNSRYGKSDCDMRYAPAEALEKFVIDQLKIIAKDKKRIDKIVRDANKDTDKIIKKLVKEKIEFERKLPPINDHLENILNAIGKGLSKVSTINKKIHDLEEQKASLERNIENVGFEIDKLKSKALNAKIMHQSLKKFSEISDTAEPEELKQQIAQFVENITFTPTEIKIALYEQEVHRGQFVNHPENGAPDGSEWLPREDSNLGHSG